MGTRRGRAIVPVAAVLVMTLAGCSGTDSDPVDVVQVVSAPGAGSTTWRYDLGALSDVAGGDYEKLRGQVATSPGGTDEQGAADGTRYAAGWSRSVSQSTADDACDELAAWFTDNARHLPGDLDESLGRVPSSRTMHRRCVRAVAVQAPEGGTGSDVFLTYPNSEHGGYRYGMFAEMRTRGTAHRLTAAYMAIEQP
ncbi:MAG: hypothetical protein ABWY58_11705 [Aeromicrobium sp.]